jgi:hydrogenase-4 component B
VDGVSFYAAGAVYRAAHTVDLERLGGLARKMPRTATLFLLGGVAMSALPPLNGFVSELAVYAGLLSGDAKGATANAAFVCAAALLAFVGAISALSTVRAFGVAFLGQPRDPSVHPSEAPRSMLWPMIAHAIGVIAIGLAPQLGVALARPVTSMFLGAETRAELGRVDGWVGSLQVATLVLVSSLVVLGVLGWRSGRGARSHVTWGCGYTAPNTRMQYSASSFSAQLAQIFQGALPQLRRERLPKEVFPSEQGHLSTHHVDAVERRMFEVLGQGEDMITHASEKIPEQPRFAFAAGLVAIIVVVALLVGAAR